MFDVNKKLLEVCWSKYNKEIKSSWEDIAEAYDYASGGEALRCAFKKYRKSLGLLGTSHSKEDVVDEQNYKLVTDALYGSFGYSEHVIKQKRTTDEMLEQLKYQNLNTMIISKSNKPRLVISDVHLPFAIDDWLDFILSTHARFGCDEEIIINGDLVDNHQISFHTSETDALSANEEYEITRQMIGKLVSYFPKALMTIGNHDQLLVRRNKEIGIDKRFLKDFHALYDLPETWKLADYFIVDGVYYRHIGCCGGKTGHINSAISNRMSTVSSHLHANGGIGYITSPNGETIFGLNTGALCDDDKYAFRYGTNARFKATLGCGVVVNPQEAYFVPYNK